MPVYKEKSGTWRVNYRFTDWTGANKQTTKRGFATRREAVAWEKEQSIKLKASLNMTPFRKHFKAGSMIICDDKACIKNFASNNDMTSDVIPSLANQTRFTTDKGNSLSSVNELHTEAKNLIRQKHGISTRHFQGYLDWILFRKRLRYTLEMTKWKSAAYMDTMQELIPFTAGDIVKLPMPVDLYEAYGSYHYGIFACIN